MLGFYFLRRLGMSKTSTTTSLFSIIRFFSTANFNNTNNNQSFAVSYLINSFGFTSKTAESISKRFYFDTPDKPDSVILFFKEQGFTISQISKIVKARPDVLLAEPKVKLLPKLEFLLSKGVSTSDLPIIVSKNTELLSRHLERFLIPSYDILKTALVSNSKVIMALKRMSPISMSKLLTDFTVNLSLLIEIKVPQSTISVLITKDPTIMCRNVGKFAEGVKKVLEMGFDPSKQSSVWALKVFLGFSDKTWQQKKDIYMRLGFSEDEFFTLFRKHPLSVTKSEKNVTSKMDFLVHKMGWRPTDIARFPVVLCYSLETRIIPRCLVVRVLLLKGFIEEDIPLSSVMNISEDVFLKKFVIMYQEEMPQLLDLFQGKVSLSELGFGLDQESGIRGRAACQS